MKTIDKKSWPRASHFGLFSKAGFPHVSVTALIDCTPLMMVLKPSGVSVHNAALYALMRAVNGVPEFRQRVRGGDVVEYDVVHASTTVPISGDRFGFCNVHYDEDFAVFNARCDEEIARAEAQEELVDDVAHEDDWVYLSCLPWLNFTAMNNPLSGPDDFIPRVVWGKITKKHGVWQMPVGVEAHHGLVDGVHVARVFEGAEKTLGNVKLFGI